MVLIRMSLPVVVLSFTACATDPATRTTAPSLVNSAYVTAPAPLVGVIVCPICGEPVTTASPVAYYGVFPVYCSSLDDARQFAALSREQRAKSAAAQVLPQKRITNLTCPLTGEPLTAAAAPVLYEGEIVGFGTLADANQFSALSAQKKKAMIAAWRAAAPASTAGASVP